MLTHRHYAAKRPAKKDAFPVDLEALTITYGLKDTYHDNKVLETYDDFFLLQTDAGEVYYSLLDDYDYVKDEDYDPYSDDLSEEAYIYLKSITQHELGHATTGASSIKELNAALQRYGKILQDYLGATPGFYEAVILKATFYRVRIGDLPSTAHDTLAHACLQVYDYYSELAQANGKHINIKQPLPKEVEEAKAWCDDLASQVEMVTGKSVPLASLEHKSLSAPLLAKLEQEDLSRI